MSELLGLSNAVDWSDLAKLLSRFALNASAAGAVVLAYRHLYRKHEYVFTYVLFNTITFFLCLLLRKVPAELGFALALFGVFGILRYRTEQIRIRELTYLFVVIGIGILNAVANKRISVAELIAVNSTIVALTLLLEIGPRRGMEEATPMLYDQLDLLAPAREAELYDDVARRTGLKLHRIELTRIDLLRDAAEITIYHRRGNRSKAASA